jgi:hypothetical protein
MNTYAKAEGPFLVIMACSFLTAVGVANVSNENTRTKSEPSITVAARVIQDVYEPNEPVPLVVAIANHSSESIYLFTDRPDIYGTSAGVRDVNGARIEGDPVPTPPPPPLHYYMEKHGKQIYVVPVSKIEGHSVLLSLTPDALSRHHKHLSEGTYYLRPGAVEIIRKVSGVITRQDVPHRLWVDPTALMTKELHTPKPVKIEIRRKPEVRESVAQVQAFAWLTFLVGAVVGIGVLSLILFLKKRAITRSK